MKRLLPAALAVAAGLSATIAWELQPESTSPGVPQPRTVLATGATAPSPAPAVDAGEVWAATMLQRPLFRGDRRPAPPGSPPAVEAPAGPDQQALLTGIVTSPFGNLAIFRSVEAARATVVREGERAGGLLVRSIAPGRALVESDGTLQTLTPSFTKPGRPSTREAVNTASAPEPVSRPQAVAGTATLVPTRSGR